MSIKIRNVLLYYFLHHPSYINNKSILYYHRLILFIFLSISKLQAFQFKGTKYIANCMNQLGSFREI